MQAPVLYERHGHVALITLNRPDNRNSMTSDLLDGFAAAARAAAGDRAVRCVVITGSGTCFSAGADFRAQIQRDDGGSDEALSPLPHERSYAMYAPFLAIADVEVPVIAALNGHAIGGGFGLSLVCDLRIAARDAKYGANFARLGLAPGMAITYTLPRIVGPQRAAELVFTGRLFDGEEAERIGYAARCVPNADVLSTAMEMARAIADNAPHAVRLTKALLYRGLGWNPREHAWREAFAQAETVATEDGREGITALLAKRRPVFRGR
jgi:enoyl-CoA hydratase/carnithine racemase